MKSEKNRERPNSVVGFCRYFLVALTAFALAAVPTMVVAAEEVEGISKLGIKLNSQNKIEVDACNRL